MAASTTDKMIKTGASTVTTLSAPGKALAATSLTVGSTTNYPTDTGVVIAIRVVDSAGELVAGTYTEWLATVTSGTTLAIDASPVYGTDQVYAAGSTTQVFIPLSSYAHNRLIDGVLVEHTQAGVHTLSSNSTITSSKVITGLNDTNGNELIKVAATGSAVNEITVGNATTGNNAYLQASGGDTNLGINLITKGSGEHQINGVGFSGAWTSYTPVWTNTGTAPSLGNGTIAGKYKQIGKLVHVKFLLTAGSTTTFGTGTYLFTLPVTSVALSSANIYTGNTPIGVGAATDTGNNNYPCVVLPYSTTQFSIATIATITGSNPVFMEFGSRGLTVTTPFGWNTGDLATASFTYEAA